MTSRGARAPVTAGLLPWLMCVLAATGGAEAQTAPRSRAETPLVVDVVVAADNSGSMKRNDPGGLVPALVTEFSRQMAADAPESRLGVVTFDGTARTALGLTTVASPAFGDTLARSLARLDERGRLTDLPAGVERAIYELRAARRPQAQRAVLLVTDGITDLGNGARTAEAVSWFRDQLAPDAKRLGIRLFGIAVSDAADVHLLQTVARITDGDFWRVRSSPDVLGIWERVRERLIERGTEPTPAPPPPSSKPPWWMPTMGWSEYLQAAILLIVLICLLLYALERYRATYADVPILTAIFSNPYLRIVGILLMLLVVVRDTSREGALWSLPGAVVFIIGATVAGADFILLLVALLKGNDTFIKEHFRLERERNRYTLARDARTSAEEIAAPPAPGGGRGGGPGGPAGPGGGAPSGGRGGGRTKTFADEVDHDTVTAPGNAAALAPLLTQPELERIGMARAWALVQHPRPVRVAVVGAGFDPALRRHPAFSGVLEPARVIAGVSEGRPGDIGATALGYVAALVPGVRILPIVVFDQTYATDDRTITDGVTAAVAWSPDVMLLEFGASMRNPALTRIIKERAESVVFVAPAGNESSSNPVWPAAEDGVIAVAAATARGELATFSSYGRNVRLAAPGVDLASVAEVRDDTLVFQRLSGTSSAAGVATAVLALAMAANAGLRPAALADAAANSGEALKGHGGIRLIRAERLVQSVLERPDSSRL